MIPEPSERDWKEDFPRENGNYANECLICGELFLGHKRRVKCKTCHEEEVARWDALMDHEKAIVMKELQKRIFK